MNKKKQVYVSLVTLMCASLICLVQFRFWHPFSLAGPQFLQYYVMLIALAYATHLIINFGTNSRIKHAELNTYLLFAAIGLVRLLQGIINHKPIGYLLLLFLFHGTITSYVFAQSKRK